ncbi:recombinase family protein [Liquorilactobacillus ghanensis]
MNMKVACYVRVSTIDQAEEGYSIGQQIDRLKKFCEAKDYSIYKVYKDPGFSGSNLERPAMQQLINDCQNNKFEAVLVYKLDRLSRSQKDTLHLIEDVFNANEIAFVSLNENFDTSTAFGKASIGILSVFAQLEREQIKERMQMGKIGRAKNGLPMSWRNAPFGYRYKNRKFEIDEFQANVVKRIYNDYLSGISITKLRNTLNQEGHLGKSVPWSYRTVRQILEHRVYTGFNEYKGKVYPGIHQAIISKDVFEKVQKELKVRQIEAYKKNNNPRPFQSKYMLSGLLKCGYCSANLGLHIYVPRKDGSQSKFYKCPSSIKKKTFTNRQYSFCSQPFLNKKDLEEHVIREIRKLQLNPQSIVHEQNNISGNIKLLKQQLKKIDVKSERLMNLYINSDSFDLKMLDKKRKQIQQERAQINEQIKDIKNKTPELSPDGATAILKECGNIEKLSYEKQKLVVRKLIKEIIVKGHDISVSWRFEL